MGQHAWGWSWGWSSTLPAGPSCASYALSGSHAGTIFTRPVLGIAFTAASHLGMLHGKV